MAKLNFMLGGKVLREIDLNKERMTIGRRSSNDIQIDNLAVSGQHAEITVLGKDVYITDLNSTNGTLVNNKAITKYALQNNDVITFGKYQLVFIDEEPVNGVGDGFADTVMIRPQIDNSEELAPAAVEAKVPSETKREPTRIVADANVTPNSTEELPIQNKQETSAKGYFKILNGKKAGQDFFLDKTMIKIGTPGERLAVITKRQQGYFISHIAGDNHPLVNGQSIGMKAYPLKEHDQVEVEGVKMTLHFV